MAAASEPPSVDKTTPSLRKVEFHLARKPQSFSPNVNPNFKLETLNPNSYVKSTLVPFSQSSSSSASFNSRLVDPTDFFEDAVLAFRMPLRRIGAGLENLGNTCFLNAVIQCLTYTEPLVGYLQNGKHETTCRVAGFCALCAIQKHVSRALQASGRCLAPKDLVSHLRSISRNFRNARQEDAHEFMIHLLESMHKCCLPSGIQAESPGAYEKSLVHRIFGGRLRSQVKCLQCYHCSNTFDPFLDLSLEIIKADSLNKALKNFTAAEHLDGGERQYKCEKCKHKVKALKQLTVSRAPYVLTIHLKRFRSFSGQKIDKKVQFGSTLDLKPFVTGEYEGDLTYTLYGVLVHAGYSTHSGHYYCFVRTSNGLWYSLDDNRVIQVSERMVMEQKAYMLFYVRDRNKFVSKKTMAMVQKENLLQTMRSVSSAVPTINHVAAEKNMKEAIQSGLFVKHVENYKASEIVAQAKLSSSLKQELSKNLGKISSEPSVLENNDNNSAIPKPNLGETAQSTRFVENNRPQSSVVTTVLGRGSDSNNEPIGDSSFLEEKTSSRDCSSNAANDLGALASDMAKDDKPIAVVLPDSITQETIASKKFKKEKVRKVRIKEQRMDKLIARGDLLRRGPGKKISKSRVVGMHLSTKMLYCAAVSLRRRKKSKKIKQQSKLNLPEKLLNKEGLPANTSSVVAVASSGVEISYSLAGRTDSGMAVNGSCSREGEEDAPKEFHKNSSCNSSAGKLDEVLNSRIKSNQAVLASVKLSKETISMEAQCNDGDVSFAEKQILPPQNGVLVETTGWGGLEFPSKNAEDNSPEVVTIGHVPDEWDEEYDRGKRKKVRGLRNDFSAPNLFQEIASKKAKLKAKTGQRISINEPFRI